MKENFNVQVKLKMYFDIRHYYWSVYSTNFFSLVLTKFEVYPDENKNFSWVMVFGNIFRQENY